MQCLERTESLVKCNDLSNQANNQTYPDEMLTTFLYIFKIYDKYTIRSKCRYSNKYYFCFLKLDLKIFDREEIIELEVECLQRHIKGCNKRAKKMVNDMIRVVSTCSPCNAWVEREQLPVSLICFIVISVLICIIACVFLLFKYRNGLKTIIAREQKRL